MSVLENPIEKLPSTSPSTVKKFKKIGIQNFEDLLNYFPYKYKDYSKIKQPEKAEFGEIITVIGKVQEKKEEVSKRGLKIQFLNVKANEDSIWLVWFNQRYILFSFKKGERISAAGEVKPYFMQKALFVEEFEKVKGELIHTGRIVPYYPEKNKLSSKVIREKIFYILNLKSEIKEFLPEEIRKYNELIEEEKAYFNIHFPGNFSLQKKAKERLAFDELFLLQLATRLIRKKWEEEKKAPEIRKKLTELVESLPFKLTNAQSRAIYEIISDLKSGKPMNRFLHGDVGSGKTVVAAITSYLVVLNGYQVVLMAPTEILALQHYKTFQEIFKNTQIKIGLQTGSKKILKEGVIKDYQIIIGTHALIQEKISFKNVGLVIIDEQQRFGVLQRMMLRQKGETPHFLTMTATPIPRTAALVFYGELSISLLDEMPKGKKPVKTYFVPKLKRLDAYEWIRKKILEEGYQVYIVCPLIEESEKETMKNVKAATSEYEKLKQIFPEIPIGLLHGKMKSKEKEEIIERFKKGEIKILVSTPVIEVGIDVPTANIIVIETAERYGLSQLHQLRGRVGRGKMQAYCLIFSETASKEALERLKFFAKTTDGFKLSEYDLKHRGPGEIFGTRQHGFINVKVASLLDYKLIEKTSKAVEWFLENKNLSDYPELEKKLQSLQKKIISRD